MYSHLKNFKIDYFKTFYSAIVFGITKKTLQLLETLFSFLCLVPKIVYNNLCTGLRFCGILITRRGNNNLSIIYWHGADFKYFSKSVETRTHFRKYFPCSTPRNPLVWRIAIICRADGLSLTNVTILLSLGVRNYKEFNDCPSKAGRPRLNRIVFCALLVPIYDNNNNNNSNNNNSFPFFIGTTAETSPSLVYYNSYKHTPDNEQPPARFPGQTAPSSIYLLPRSRRTYTAVYSLINTYIEN